jgi:chemotaxis protein CheZ
MITEMDIVEQLTQSVTGRVSLVIKESLSEIVQQEVSKALAKALSEGQFYRSMNSDVIEGIENIYSEISSVKKSLSVGCSKESLDLLSETDSVLDGIVKATEKATLNILDYLETMQEELSQIRKALDTNELGHSRENLDHLDSLLLDTMTELSFQDLTGQQIRRVVQSLKKVEEVVFDVYMTSEIMKKSKEQSPEKGVDELRERAKDLVIDAKSRKVGIDQDGVDSLLEQLGL